MLTRTIGHQQEKKHQELVQFFHVSIFCVPKNIVVLLQEVLPEGMSQILLLAFTRRNPKTWFAPCWSTPGPETAVFFGTGDEFKRVFLRMVIFSRQKM